MERFGAIDVGTNSVKLTVVQREDDGQLEVIARQRYVPQLGRDVSHDGSLDVSSMERTIGAISKLVELNHGLGVHAVRAVATQAVRDAPNQSVFVDQVRACCGLELQVLQGAEEARLGWEGLCADQQVGKGVSVLLDVGGGSIECLFAAGEHVEQVVSLPLGALRMTERFDLHDRIEPRDWDSFTSHVSEVMADSLERPEPAPYAWAIGGTCTALVKLDRAGVGLTASSGVEVPSGSWAFTGLSCRRLDDVVLQLRHWSLDDRAEWTGLDRDRAAILPAGGGVLQAVLAHLGVVEGCCVTRHGVRDGLLRSMLES